jgi:hypothetical protein
MFFATGEFIVLQRALAASPRAAGLSPAESAARSLGRAPDWRERLADAAPLVAVAADAPLRELLRVMLSARVHRVFILAPSPREGQPQPRAPAGVVSMTDVLRCVADA